MKWRMSTEFMWETVHEAEVCQICGDTKTVNNRLVRNGKMKRMCGLCRIIYCIPCAFDHYKSRHIYLRGVVL